MSHWIRVKIHWIDWKTGLQGIWEEPPGDRLVG
jgi:hypothetical protein